jgi:sortase A
MFVTRTQISKVKVIPALPQLKRFLGIFFIFLGIAFFLIVPGLSQLNQIKDFHFYLSSVQAKENDSIKIDESLTNHEGEGLAPVRILIPQRNIDLDVAPAKVVKGKWEVFDDKAGFGIGSAMPGTPGNTVIFAHAKKDQFLGLKDVKMADEILIFTKDGWYSYKISEIKEVGPRDISVISQTSDSTLTLFTCSGFADTKRLIVVAKKMS